MSGDGRVSTESDVTLYLELAEEASEDEAGRTAVTKQRETTDESGVYLPLSS